MNLSKKKKKEGGKESPIILHANQNVERIEIILG